MNLGVIHGGVLRYKRSVGVLRELSLTMIMGVGVEVRRELDCCVRVVDALSG